MVELIYLNSLDHQAAFDTPYDNSYWLNIIVQVENTTGVNVTILINGL